MKNQKNLLTRIYSIINHIWLFANRFSQIKIVRLLFQILTIIFIVYLIFQNLSSFRLATQTVTINYFYLILSFFIILSVVMIIGGTSWYFINKGLGQNLGVFEAIRVQMYSNIPKYIPGTIWQYLSKMYLSRKIGAVKEAISIAIGYEMFQTIWIGICIMLISFSQNYENIQNITYAPKIIMGVGIFGLLASFSFPLWGGRLFQNILGTAFKVNPIPLIYSALIIFIGWLLSIWGFWIISMSLFNTSLGELNVFSFAYSSALIGGILAIPVPNGLGVREGIMVLSLHNTMPEYLSIILAGISRIEIILSEVIGAIIVWIISFFRNKSLKMEN